MARSTFRQSTPARIVSIVAVVATIAFAVAAVAVVTDGTDTEVVTDETLGLRLDRPTVLPRGARVLVELRGERVPARAEIEAPSFLVGGGVKTLKPQATVHWSVSPLDSTPYGSHPVSLRVGASVLQWQIEVRHRSGLPICLVRAAGLVLLPVYFLWGAILIRELRRTGLPPLGLEHAVFAMIVLANLAVPVVLFLRSWPKWSQGFAGEGSPINTFSAVQCALLGLVAAALFVTNRLDERRAWPWLVAALGFVYLAGDERFGIHERTSDALLPLLALAGVVLTWFLVDDLRRRPSSLAFFVGAVAVALILVLQDASSSTFFDRRAVRRLQIVVEETGEIWVQAIFGIAMVGVLASRSRSRRTRRSDRTPGPTGGRPNGRSPRPGDCRPGA